MNRAIVDKIVQAVLYEGYNLYPYRPSVKNRCRWTFGGLVPRSYSEAVDGTDAWHMQVQCLLQPVGNAGQPQIEKCTLEVTLRYLHLMQRTIGVLPGPCDELPAGRDPPYEAVDSLLFNAVRYQSWQEAVEREVTVGPLELVAHSGRADVTSFTAPASHVLEPLRGPNGRIGAVVVRDQSSVEGSAEISTELLEGSVFRLTVRVFNRAGPEVARASSPSSSTQAGSLSRDEALMRSLVAVHVVVSVRGGRFFSLTDPPEALREATDACRNLGAWPVLVGSPGQQDAMLASPIILYDYPEIAPESPGDLFDGTEIDELLTLRIMTLTEEEKAMAHATDDRTRRLIERTESLAREQLAGLHGAVRSPAPRGMDFPVRPDSNGEVEDPSCNSRDGLGGPSCDSAAPDWDPFAQPSTVNTILVDDVLLRAGDRVRLRPGLGGDIFDLALAGKTATIESIEQDYEDQLHVAVTLDDDPGQDLGRARQPGHRFFFKPEEVAPLTDNGR